MQCIHNHRSTQRSRDSTRHVDTELAVVVTREVVVVMAVVMIQTMVVMVVADTELASALVVKMSNHIDQ